MIDKNIKSISLDMLGKFYKKISTIFATNAELCKNNYDEISGGKNLFSKEDITRDYVIDSTGRYQNSTEGSFYTGKIYVIPGTSYAVQGFSNKETENWFYDEKNKPIKSIGDCSNSVFTVPSNCSYIRLSGKLDDEQSIIVSEKEVPYEPYFPSNKMLEDERRTLSSDLIDIKMLGWSVPKNFLIKNYIQNNYFIQKVCRVSLPDLNWNYNQTAKRFETELSGKRYGVDNIYSSVYEVNEDVYKHDDGTNIEITEGVSGDPSSRMIYIRSKNVIGVESLKTTLKDEYLYYELDSSSYVTHRLDKGGEVTENIETRVKILENRDISNLLIPTGKDSETNGITCTYNHDGTYSLNGTSTSNTEILLGEASGLVLNRQYKILGSPNIKGVYVCSKYYDIYDYGNGGLFLATDTRTSLTLKISSNIPLNSVKIKPMVTDAVNATYDDFVPYTGNSVRILKTLKEVAPASAGCRDKAMIFGNLNNPVRRNFYPLLGIKSYSGSWTIGTSSDSIAFNYVDDTEYAGGLRPESKRKIVYLNRPSAGCSIITNRDIANNLTTTSTGYVLDASQGKILYDSIHRTSNLTSSITKSDNVQSLWSTNLTKYLQLAIFNINITVNAYAGSTVTLCTIPDAVKPVAGTVEYNMISNRGALCYLRISDNEVSLVKMNESSWSAGDGIRTCVTYLV